ncbi:hypothetical protein BKA65DRAFT_533346 [Rhexocercosporidium sp. MPI-PUGE-AT-0058]|nr:hypothetical protein BKA65DRAFT_533346 [Rhexocercosporidium sp. MPI-PUGE-AT-0058]
MAEHQLRRFQCQLCKTTIFDNLIKMRSISFSEEYFNGTHQHDESLKYGERLLPHVVDDFAAKEPDHLAGLTAKYNSTLPMSFTPLTMSELANAVNFTSHWIDNILGKGATNVIAFIGLQDFRYWVMTLAAIKTGHPLLVPSIRNAISNTENLIKSSRCSVLFYSGTGTAIGSQAHALADSMPGLETHVLPTLEEMTSISVPDYPYNKTYAEVKSDTVLIMHTSGSTGHPKPIYINHAVLNRIDMDRFMPEVEGRTNASYYRFRGPLYNGSPFFHLSGVAVGCVSIFFGTTPVIPPPNEPATPKIARDIATSIQLKCILAAPSIIDYIFSEHGEELRDHFAGLGHIAWFGGPLAHSTGNWITTHLPSTDLYQIYGSTEANNTPLLVPPKSHWSYMEFHPLLMPDLEPIFPGSPLHELVIRRHPNPAYAWSTPVFYLFPEKEEWRTRDLFSRCTDPGFSHLWKFESRVDDILILNNALKVNPLHIEVPLLSQPLLKGVMVFGAGKVRCGILLEARDERVLGADEKEEFVESVWPDVVRAHNEVPEHARIHRDLVIVVDPKKPLPRSVKMGVVRSLATTLYAKEIEEVIMAAAGLNTRPVNSNTFSQQLGPDWKAIKLLGTGSNGIVSLWEYHGDSTKAPPITSVAVKQYLSTNLPKPLAEAVWLDALGKLVVMARGTEDAKSPAVLHGQNTTVGLVHYDIKLDNIFIGNRDPDHERYPVLVLGDLGNAMAELKDAVRAI